MMATVHKLHFLCSGVLLLLLKPVSSSKAFHQNHDSNINCNLTGHWKWTGSKSLDIEIIMTSADMFNVTLHPLIDWQTATGGDHEYSDNMPSLIITKHVYCLNKQLTYMHETKYVGHLRQYWNGTGAVSMVSAGGSHMDGYVYSACNIITAGVNAGSWLRVGAPVPPTPAPNPPVPLSDADVVWTTPSADVLGSMPLGNGKLVRFAKLPR